MNSKKAFRIFLCVLIVLSGVGAAISNSTREMMLWIMTLMWQFLVYIYDKHIDNYKEITDLQSQIMKDQEELICRLKDKVIKEVITIKK